MVGNIPFVNKVPFRIVAATVSLCTFVLFNSYNCTLITYLTVPKMKPAINSLEDLAASKDVKLVVEFGSVLGSQFLVRAT